MPKQYIKIRGANEHNLKNINLVYKGKLKDYNKNKVAKYEVAY